MVDLLDYLTRAQKALDEGELDMAERYYHQVLSQNPENRDAIHGLKQVQIRRAQSGSPIAWWIQFLRGATLVTLGRAASAYDVLEMAHHTHPSYVPAALMFARAALACGKTDEAHQVYDTILRHNPNHVAALRADTDLLVQAERYEEATDHLQRLQALFPNDDKLTHRLRDITALSYSRTGIPKNLTERRATMEKAKLDSLDSHQFTDRLEALQHQFHEDPDNHELGVTLARHMREGKHYDKASRILATILDAHPGYTPARREQARIWMLTGDLSISASLYEELLADAPHDRELKHEYHEAHIALLQKQAQETPNDRDLAHRLETLKIERDRNRMTWLQSTLRDHPERHGDRIELGTLMLKYGKVDEAVETVQRLLHDPSSAGKGHFLLGQCFHAKGDRSLAAQQMEKALTLLQNRSYTQAPSAEMKEAWYRLGLIREEMGDPRAAREAFSQVYSVDVNYRDVKTRYEALMQKAP